jgi:hypothetical protein
MDPDRIERAYVPFVILLRQGGFAPPAEGWSAELDLRQQSPSVPVALVFDSR